MLYPFLWLLLSWLSCCSADTSIGLASLSAYENAYVAQRDISSIIPVDQLTAFGISLNKIVFDKVGYANTSLSYVSTFLNLKTSMFMLDLYWNEATRRWQLCPAPFPVNLTLDLSQTVDIPWNGKTYTCQPSFTIYRLFNLFELYLSRTNVRTEANVIQLAFNLKVIPSNHLNTTLFNNTASGKIITPAQYRTDFTRTGNATLPESLSPLSDYLFSPLKYLETQSSWAHDSSQQFYHSSFPTQYELIYDLYKRVVPFVLTNELSNSSSYALKTDDYNLIYFPDHFDFAPFVTQLEDQAFQDDMDDIRSESTSSKVFADIVNNTQFRLAADSDDVSFDNETITDYLKSGFTVLLNSSDYGSDDGDDDASIWHILREFIPVSLWSWAPREPVVAATNTSLNNFEGNDSWFSASTTQSANQCVSIGQTGWGVMNCYDEMRWACKNNSNPFSWEISDEKGTYFQLSKAGCPKGFSVGVPRLSIEQFSLLSLLRSRNIDMPVWIDLNDITVSGCYVSGGPYALCPYREVVTTKSFIKSLAPSSVVALFILFLIFWEAVSPIPIHSNRKRHWKKTITNYYKENDYEGVPL